MTYQSASGLRGNPTYSSPEILQFNEFTKSSDVYSFGFIAFEILTSEIPFKGIVNKNDIFNKVVDKASRPEIPSTLPSIYRNLIERCWSQEKTDRPTFEDIVEHLKSDSNFITELIQSDYYYNYIEFIDESQKSFDSTKRILDLSEFIQSKSRINEEVANGNEMNDDFTSESKELKIKEENKSFDSISISRCEKVKEETQNNQNEDNKMKINETDNKIKEMQILSEQNENDVASIKKLAKKFSIENDTEKTYLYMNKLICLGEFEIPMEYAINLYKQKKFKVSMNYFKLLSKFNHPIAHFFIGVMKYKGEGCEIDRTESYSIMKYLSDSGIDKATEFIDYNF